MTFWRKTEEQAPQASLARLEEKIGLLSQDLTDCTLRIQKIDADIKSLRLEWTDTYDKVYKVLDRFRKRWDREKAVERRQEAQETPTEGLNGSGKVPAQQIIDYARQRGLLR